MVVAPTATIDWGINQGDQIKIEERHPNELLPESYLEDSVVSAWNPVFDVTPVELITAIVTERGVVHNPAVGQGVRGLK
jgi:methylthioribose-1-phosphate isomerase